MTLTAILATPAILAAAVAAGLKVDRLVAAHPAGLGVEHGEVAS